MGIVREKHNAQYKREKKIKEHIKDNKRFEIKLEKVNEIQETKESKNTKLQWHPAFYAGIQIELERESENLIFENEHQLGTKPKEIDVLIIKKNKDIPIEKNIGRIFRKYNIIEYKSPEDWLSVNDFYRVMGYTYFYKADTKSEDEIKIEDMTVTFVTRRYPRGLVRHLTGTGDEIIEKDSGIYYINGEKVPIQLIVTSRLSEEHNFWLKNLTNDLRDKQTVDKMMKEYEKNNRNIFYKSVMDVIVRANDNMFEEGENMCDAMMEILKDRIDVLRKKSWEDGALQGRLEGIRLAKMIMRMNIEGMDCRTIAEKCLLTVDEVQEILRA